MHIVKKVLWLMVLREIYIDFYLNIKEEGNYVLTYKIKDSEAITNGLKLSGGLGLATDNLGSVSFGKYWGKCTRLCTDVEFKSW